MDTIGTQVTVLISGVFLIFVRDFQNWDTRLSIFEYLFQGCPSTLRGSTVLNCFSSCKSFCTSPALMKIVYTMLLLCG